MNRIAAATMIALMSVAVLVASRQTYINSWDN